MITTYTPKKNIKTDSVYYDETRKNSYKNLLCPWVKTTLLTLFPRIENKSNYCGLKKDLPM